MQAVSNRLGIAGAFLLVAVLTLAYIGSSAQQPKPVRENALITHFRTPPPTLNEMILSADLVVVGRIVGSRPDDTERPPRVKSLWAVKVNEVLHIGVGGAQPSEILIEREGGDRDRGSHIDRVIQPEFPMFKPGQEYILFLRKAGDLGFWWPAYGPDSAFRLSHGRVEAVGTSEVSLSQSGQTDDEFLRTIRNFGIK
jgi:hypothetical protein